MRTARMKKDKATDEEGKKKRGVSMQRSKAGTKKNKSNSLYLPNQNTTIINKIW